MKSIYLNQCTITTNAERVHVQLMVKDKYIVNKKISYVLGDITGDIEFVSIDNFNVGDIVLVGIANSKVINVKLDYKQHDLRDFICHVKRDIKDIMIELEEETTNQFKDEEVLTLNKYFFENSSFVKEFAKGIGGLAHHTYIGGLAEHTLNVVHFSNEFANRYNCRYKEMVILAAKLHDIGKIYEYSSEGMFKRTLRGEMEGHIVIGITMIEEAFENSLGSYSESFKNRIKGCIVQHHGKPKYGSPKEPNTQEAFILHYADYVDATMDKVSKVRDSTHMDSWSKYDEGIKTKLYI
ncbi:MAG: HD domain-containing protein [Clostridium sp.]|uniref:HD domain-containing protein n=1 Tax=Clostridium sp. TaxID=1506 RepID=UPI0030565183